MSFSFNHQKSDYSKSQVEEYATLRIYSIFLGVKQRINSNSGDTFKE